MVRIKPAPEPLFPKGRITVRQTTRELIHEVAVEDEQRFGRDRGPQYSVEYPQSPTRQNDRNTFEPSDRQNSGTFSSRHYEGPNEYMISEPIFAKPSQDVRREYRGQDGVHPSHSKMDRIGNEYMTGEREYSSRSKQKEQSSRRYMDRSFSRNFDGSSEYMTESSYVQPMDTRRVTNGDESSHHLGERNRMLYRTKVIPQLRDGYRDLDRANARAFAARRSGGTPRFGGKSFGRGSMKRRHRPGALALKEIRRLQKSTHILIPRLPLQRVMREVVRELYPQGEYRFTVECCEALQEAAEIHLVQTFADANSCAIHAKRVTVKPDDIHLVRMLQKW